MSVEQKVDEIVETVRDRYGRIAAGRTSGCCGSGIPVTEKAVSLGVGYSADDLKAIPEEADLGLGCGAPISALDLQPGETVLDLGAGAGMDAFLAAKFVGKAGRVIGVDMTPEMLARARTTAVHRGFPQVEFREGRLEQLPVTDQSIDAVTSNCVINLVPDKAAVFREVARVLKPGGRLVISDIVLDGPLPAALLDDILAYVGCVAGARPRAEYFALLGDAGLTELDVLKDVDFLAGLAKAAPEEAQALLARTGVSLSDLEGRVRSITYRARKPRA